MAKWIINMSDCKGVAVKVWPTLEEGCEQKESSGAQVLAGVICRTAAKAARRHSSSQEVTSVYIDNLQSSCCLVFELTLSALTSYHHGHYCTIAGFDAHLAPSLSGIVATHPRQNGLD